MSTVNYESRRRALAGEPMMGTFVNTGSPISAELAAQAGLDWLMLDLEHGMGSWEGLLQQFIAVSGHPITPVVRLPFLRPEYFKKAFDMGAMGVMVPYVESAEQAAGILGFDPGQIGDLLADGFSFLSVGSDGGYLAAAFSNLAEKFREISGSD